MQKVLETCEQYVARRLSEGWRIAGRWGHLVMLSPPDGSFLRVVDLRNDIETLRPNAAGDETNIETQYPDSTFHWDKVDEATPDEDDTYVASFAVDWQRDLYNLPAHAAGSGTINSITIYIRIKSGDDIGHAWVSQKSGVTVTDGTVKDQGTSWATKSQVYTTNPATGSAYTWEEIDDLQIGVQLIETDTSDYTYCTQVYVEVDYALVAPTVTTQAASSVGATTARLNGQISNDGGDTCQYRFRYKKAGGSYSYTTWTGAKTTGQTFYEDISDLEKKSLYYFNAQAKNFAGEGAWGSELSFTTLATIPIVSTQAVDNIEATTATGHGNITDIGGENASKRGVCWNTTGNPTVADSKSEEAGSFGTGAFTRPMTGLTPGQHYYVKAYAYNSAGYGYGSQVEFTTIEAPTVTTQAVSDIEATTATGNGTITDIGGENCTKRGVCWNTTGNPTVADSKSEEAGSFGVGAFTRPMTGLTPEQHYYVKAYAYNSAGYGYGSQVEFDTLPPPPAAPTNVQATDGAYPDKVVITWTKSAGATGYQVYRDGVALGWLGDVATYNDLGADAPSITPGSSVASDGAYTDKVALSLSGTGTNNGTTHTYKVRARNAGGESPDSATDTGYRAPGSLTYQWQRSAADSDAGYSDISGATTASYDDTGAPVDGSGRYYRCRLNATGAAQQYSASDRGYRLWEPPAPPAAPEYQKRETARIGPEAEATLKEILSRVTEFSADSGTATGGSTTSVVDSKKNWATDMWKSAVCEVYDVSEDKYYLRVISANDATTLTIAEVPAAVVSGDPYAIRLTIGLVDLDKCGGTALTGRDISLDLKALTDDSIKGLLKSIGDIAALENLITRIGQTADAMVAAGAVGSMSAKLRRLTNDLSALITAVGLLPQLATTPVIYNVTMTLADTQYSQALPANTKKYTIQTRDGTEFRMAFVTGKVAAPTEPYFTIGTDGFHHEDSINPASLTLYFACGEAAKVAEIIAWS